ncbi:hypothetical protein TorRG33x02_249690 [Trema orientale]|uniref:Uncharacterized protein n=1 Tax=Trema orientale TaxID=63057 RepID=A0A2P5DJN4_TREOI|nr:hypothetical protein TorRG33x02_249690 [Trema orientale]
MTLASKVDYSKPLPLVFSNKVRVLPERFLGRKSSPPPPPKSSFLIHFSPPPPRPPPPAPLPSS